MTAAQDVLAVAAGEIGTTEWPPGSNRVEYSRWYADAIGDASFASGPWCAMFVSWVFDRAGCSELVAAQNRHGFAYCPSGLRWFDRRGALTSRPRPGDVVFFDWESDRVADHVGIVERVNGDGSLTTLEGNTSPGASGSQSNGGGVYRRTRPMSTVRGVGRPAYGGAVPEEEPGVLCRGDRGAEVADWQQALLRWDPQALPVHGADGDFGSETDAATRALQEELGLGADGVVGSETRRALDALLRARPQAAVPAGVPPLERVLSLGSSGEDVKALQSRLAERGWSLAVDGAFGPVTDSVVRQYQAEHGLEVDGAVGPETWSSVFTAPVD